jgi:purine nucleosidase
MGSSLPPPIPGAPKPVLIIHDMDQDSDVDDVMDQAMLYSFHQLGLAKVLGVICSSSCLTTAPCAKALLDYSIPGNNIPVAQYNGATSLVAGSTYSPTVTNCFGKTADVAGNYPSHISTYRSLLAAAAPNSVVITCGGSAASIADLLASAADTTSTLTGVQLVAAKVKALYWEAGYFNGSSSVEYNIGADLTAAQYLLANWPSTVPVIWAGDEVTGGGIATQPPLSADPLISPYRRAMNLQLGAGNARPAWCQCAIYCAVVGFGSFFEYGGANGTVTMSGTGVTTWSATPGNHSFIEPLNSGAPLTATISAEFNRIIATVSGSPILTAAMTYPSEDFSNLPTVTWGRPSDPATVSGTGTALTVQDLAPSGQLAIVPTANGATATPTGPTIVASAINGLQALSFDGVANQLDISYAAKALSGGVVPFHAFFVVNLGKGGAEQTLLDICTTAIGSRATHRIRIDTTTATPPGIQAARVYTSFSDYVGGHSLALSTWSIIEVVFNPFAASPGQLTTILNGSTVDQGGTADMTTPIPFTIGRLMTSFVDNGTTPNYACQAELAEWVIIKGQVLNGLERVKRLRYLNTRYALGLTF